MRGVADVEECHREVATHSGDRHAAVGADDQARSPSIPTPSRRSVPGMVSDSSSAICAGLATLTTSSCPVPSLVSPPVDVVLAT